MTEDARFEDAQEAPLLLLAQDSDDLTVLSALVQDAVLGVEDMRWERAQRRFALLVNRFRWEDSAAPQRRRRPYERVRSLVVIGDVAGVASQGVDRGAAGTVLSVLSVGFEPGADGTGRVVVTFAGDGAIALDVECLDVTLRDVTRPYLAQSVHPPRHPEDG